MFRVFGHDRIWVLDGGLPRWRASGYDVESSASSDAILKASAASEAIEKVYQGQRVSLCYQLTCSSPLIFLRCLSFTLAQYGSPSSHTVMLFSGNTRLTSTCALFL